ncbi:Gfo/Idh/MocA family protein [Marinigracilibium pacificum]|uniref:Gfo/Idh/MocA family oxidoreductase n=1 Tax=Marinigracilibium pacificum TaxID=2729599 RepID=A0A848IZZ1_9BACT|nr:Gfo/Idh/MocA family oxidoreductase [Marinigracilibium pacificum]NMM47569.1 Gfo/Idh/MocA family oxidoreductase [Marinigracilibium pacificum]
MGLKSRRTFIRSGLLAGAGLLTGASYLYGRQLSFGNERVRIGIIGTGSRGKGLGILINQIDGLKVVACADVIPFRLEEGLRVCKNAKGYANYEELLDDKNVDAVIIATPFSMHDEMSIAALDAGKHVYCEKTMAKGINEIQEVISSVAQQSLVFQTGHQYHSSPLYQRARQIIKEGNLGEITAYKCQWNRNGDWRRPVPDPKWERLINWRMYKEYSGGLIAELMSHQIDFINWVTGSHPEKIVGFGGIDYWNDGRETYDNVNVMYEYPTGLDASFTCTTSNSYDDYQIKVLGSEGTMILGYTEGTVYREQKTSKEIGVVDGVSGATLKAWDSGEGVSVEAHAKDPTLDALKQFYDAIVHDKKVESNINTGALTAKCVQVSLDALYTEEIKYWKDYPELMVVP